jgi:hypothetical protein
MVVSQRLQLRPFDASFTLVGHCGTLPHHLQVPTKSIRPCMAKQRTGRYAVPDGLQAMNGRVAGVDLPGLRPECSCESDRQIAPSTATIAQGCLLGADCRWWPWAMVGCSSAVRPQPPADVERLIRSG